jgi:DNA ligase (NAD+)
LQKILERDETSPLALVGELKIDGNALALSYEAGVLVRAATRGDGNRGEEITANVRTIQSVPLRLQINDPPAWVEVRGEAFIPDQTFAAINAERQSRGEALFANPRNACAGTLRQLDPKVVAARRLDFFAYTLHLPHASHNPRSQWEALEWLRKAGFKVNPNAALLAELGAAKTFCRKWDLARHQLAYATDGVVLKLDDLKLQDAAGFTQKAPRWAIALKYAAEEAPSKLLRLSCQVGRSGAITPIAEFEPVALAGTMVSRASLHNADRLLELDLHAGDTIVVRKAGEIIPEVLRVLFELRPANAIALSLPKSCPECGSEVVREVGEAATRCVNSSCPAILRGALRHWAGRDAMDIDGLGGKLIEQLVDRSLVRSIADLYRLDAALLASLERMGELSARNLIGALDSSRQCPWDRLLFGLGIHHVGIVNARTLAKAYPSWTELERVACGHAGDRGAAQELTALQGIGPEIAQSLQQWCSTEANRALMGELEILGLNLAQINDGTGSPPTEGPLSGVTIVLTGTLANLSRADAEELIRASGGKVTSSVSRRTDWVVAGEEAGSKLAKALNLGVPVLDEAGLLAMCEGGELTNKGIQREDSNKLP